MALATAAQDARPAPARPVASVAADYGNLPLSFEANRGQFDPGVQFLARGAGYGLYLNSREAVLVLRSKRRQRVRHAPERDTTPPQVIRTDVVRMELRGANTAAKPAGIDSLPGSVNYFLGPDPAKWHTGIATYSKVKFGDIYPGVDLVYYGNHGQLEYDFVVAAQANPKAIQLHFAGATKLSLTPAGDLTVKSISGQIAFHKPNVYQDVNGCRQQVAGQFALLANHQVGFRLGAYNRAQKLVIDPVLVYSTYLGGSGAGEFEGDGAQAIAADGAGNAYVAGFTYSPNFPVTPNSLQKKNVASDVDNPVMAFVSKLNPAGTALVYSTYLGGSGGSSANAIAVDGLGRAYIAGNTWGGFPVTPEAFQTAYGGNGDGFVAELNATGSGLVYASYLGGDGNESANAVALNSIGDAYVAGSTFSTDFPTRPGSYQATNHASSGTAFVAAVNATGAGLIYSTYLGGSNSDSAQGIAVDASGNAYVAGTSTSKDFPLTPGAYLSANEGGFITKLNPTGSALVYSTYFNAGVAAIALDSTNEAYVTGAPGTAFPVTPGALQSAAPNGYISKLNSAGEALVYSATIACGTGDSIAVDTAGDAIVAGFTGGSFLYAYSAACTDLPVTPGAFEVSPLRGGEVGAAFVMKLNQSGTALLYSTFLAGSGYGASGDGASAVAVDSSGNAYVAGTATSYDFPVTLGAIQTVNRNGFSNGLFFEQAPYTPTGFVSKLALADPTPTTPTTISLAAVTSPPYYYALLGNGPPYFTPNSPYPGYLEIFSQPSTYLATVTTDGANTVRTGNVAFVVNGAEAETVPLAPDGTASFTTSSLNFGTTVLQAFYTGSTNLSVSDTTVNVGVIPATPSISGAGSYVGAVQPNGGKYIGPVTVTISSVSPGTTIYYTLDGSLPGTGSTVYSRPFVLSAPGTMVRAIAGPKGQGTTAITQTYTFFYVVPQTPTPVISLASGTYPVGQLIAITDAVPTATIRYTTDGSNPTQSSNWYHGPFPLNGPETIKAIAFSTGDAVSQPAVAIYSN